ncbi:Uncharacterised protein [Mycobacterium tuberculosis]|nr:Uncharacterised protein [Mycobacterium tuberculosis]
MPGRFSQYGPFPPDLRLGSRRLGGVGGRQQIHRPTQSDLVGGRRARRIFRLVPLVGDGAVHAHIGVRLFRRRQVPARRHRDLGRGMPALPLHICHRKVRGAQLDHLFRTGAVDSDRWQHSVAGQPWFATVAVSGVRCASRPRRRQLRRLHDEHQRFLSATTQGRRACAQRGWRQPRGADGAVGRPAGDRNGR